MSILMIKDTPRIADILPRLIAAGIAEAAALPTSDLSDFGQPA